MSEEEIIRIYGKRWDIEAFFKTCKSFLNLGSEYHGLSYDALTAHVAMVFTRYMLMSVTKRDDEDERTLGELFYFMVDEATDITFSQLMKTLLGCNAGKCNVCLSGFRRTDHRIHEQFH